MSLKLTKFDFEFFIKKQFILNFAIGVFGYLFALTINKGFEKNVLHLIYIIYFLLIIFSYIKLKKNHDAISYSKHRILGHFFVSLVFSIIGSTLLLELNSILLYSGILFYFVLVLFFYLNKNKRKFNYDSLFLKKINDPNDVSLYEFYEFFDEVVNKKNKFTPILVFLGMQVGLIVFLNGFLKIDQYYGPFIIVAIFFLISFYILNKTFFYLIVPYRFLNNIKL